MEGQRPAPHTRGEEGAVELSWLSRKECGRKWGERSSGPDPTPSLHTHGVLVLEVCP